MERKIFEQMLKNNNAIPLNGSYVLFNDLELYNYSTKEACQFSTLSELYEYSFGGKTFGEFIDETEKFILKFNGGRGANYNSQMGGGFGHASGSNGGGDTPRFNSEFNAGAKIGQRFREYKEIEKLFRKKYVSSDHEFGIAVDKNGFVTRHIEGGKTGVSIQGYNDEIIVHNHPSFMGKDGGNFSDSDLLSAASTKSRGIVAISRDYTHTFEKKPNFKPKDFMKAVKGAKWPIRYNYDDGADWWLRQNARKYGYTYSRISSKRS